MASWKEEASSDIPMESESTEDELNLIQQQLSCLATTDKDVLISQLQKIIGPSINSYAAQFFLDMNNWNLQLAVGSYFDLVGNGQSQDTEVRGSTTAFSARCAFGNEIVPLTSTQGTFAIQFQNVGTTPWPSGTYLRYLTGSSNLVCDSYNGMPKRFIDRVNVGALMPEETHEIRLNLHSDGSTIPMVTMTWQLCTPEGYLFGELITINIKLEFDELNNRMKLLST